VPVEELRQGLGSMKLARQAWSLPKVREAKKTLSLIAHCEQSLKARGPAVLLMQVLRAAKALRRDVALQGVSLRFLEAATDVGSGPARDDADEAAVLESPFPTPNSAVATPPYARTAAQALLPLASGSDGSTPGTRVDLQRRLRRQMDHRFSDTDSERETGTSRLRTVSLACEEDQNESARWVYWDDPLNTDTQWVEAEVLHYHADDGSFATLLPELMHRGLQAGRDIGWCDMLWIPLHRHVALSAPDEAALAHLAVLSLQPEPFW
jgi:hypothetical protein